MNQITYRNSHRLQKIESQKGMGASYECHHFPVAPSPPTEKPLNIRTIEHGTNGIHEGAKIWQDEYSLHSRFSSAEVTFFVVRVYRRKI